SRSRPRGVIFAIHDPLGAELATGAAIALLFGLPQATANLTAAVTTGEDLQDYAERLGISVNTARYHLKTAFERIGVRSQAELSRRVTTALRDLSDHRGS
ncbi:MAG: helix-turn-helix transcriptional regulator, partial [Rhizobiaceae bacterium]